MKKDERIQLENLSKLVYGNKNKYRKMVEKGELVAATDEKGRKIQRTSYYSYDEVKTIMQDIWKEEQENQAKEKELEEKKDE